MSSLDRIIYLAGVETNTLTEAPLPDTWDKDEFGSSFESQLQYAHKMSKKIGAGSSRVAFVITYEGRETVLKIAKNGRGLAQNYREIEISTDSQAPKCLIPLIDYDKSQESPRWIHTEKADRINKREFRRLTGFSFIDFVDLLDNIFKGNDINYVPPKIARALNNDPLFIQVKKLIEEFELVPGDLKRVENWGIYNGKPVIIDFGFDKDYVETYKMKKKPIFI